MIITIIPTTAVRDAAHLAAEMGMILQSNGHAAVLAPQRLPGYTPINVTVKAKVKAKAKAKAA